MAGMCQKVALRLLLIVHLSGLVCSQRQCGRWVEVSSVFPDVRGCYFQNHPIDSERVIFTNTAGEIRRGSTLAILINDNDATGVLLDGAQWMIARIFLGGHRDGTADIDDVLCVGTNNWREAKHPTEVESWRCNVNLDDIFTANEGTMMACGCSGDAFDEGKEVTIDTVRHVEAHDRELQWTTDDDDSWGALLDDDWPTSTTDDDDSVSRTTFFEDGDENSSNSPETLSPTESSSTPVPTPSLETPSPTESASTPLPTEAPETPLPTASRSTPSPSKSPETPSPTVVVVSATPSPTERISLATDSPSTVPTIEPTAPPGVSNTMTSQETVGPTPSSPLPTPSLSPNTESTQVPTLNTNPDSSFGHETWEPPMWPVSPTPSPLGVAPTGAPTPDPSGSGSGQGLIPPTASPTISTSAPTVTIHSMNPTSSSTSGGTDVGTVSPTVSPTYKLESSSNPSSSAIGGGGGDSSSSTTAFGGASSDSTPSPIQSTQVEGSLGTASSSGAIGSPQRFMTRTVLLVFTIWAVYRTS